MTAARRIAVVSAGLSTPSSTRMLADRLAAAVVRELAGHGLDATADTVELRDHAHDITNNLLTGFPSPALETAVNTVVSADALIAVTPIFSTSYSGLFKSFVDILDKDSLIGMPVLLGATAGSPRHTLAIDYAIRPVFAYLHADVMSTGVFAASADWGSADQGVAALADRIARGAAELAAVVARRDPRTAADPYDPDTYLGEGKSFGNLLGGLAGE